MTHFSDSLSAHLESPVANHGQRASQPDLEVDPFREQGPVFKRRPLALLGTLVRFESNSRELLALVEVAYRDLPAHRLPPNTPRLRIRLELLPIAPVSRQRRSAPPPLKMFSGAGLVGSAPPATGFIVVSTDGSAALVAVTPELLSFPYHLRYEWIEFAVFTLATRVRRLVPLHAACISDRGRGLLLMGDSGAGKSTVSLLSVTAGLEFVAEDSVFVDPNTLQATAVANFLHVRADSLRWLSRAEATAIRQSPVIRRRSGVRKFELDLRQPPYRLATRPPRLTHVVFLSSQSAQDPDALLAPLPKGALRSRLTALQPYAAALPQWQPFERNLFRHTMPLELRRGAHPLQSVQALRTLLA